MAQHDLNIANQTSSSARADINNALAALGSTHSGSTPPTNASLEGQLWYDTTSDRLKIRVGSSWVELTNALNTGTGANNLVKLDGSARLPALNGSLLTNLPQQDIPSVTWGNEIITTSGGVAQQNAIPNGVTEVNVFLNDISHDTTAQYLIRLGTGTTVKNNGYICSDGPIIGTFGFFVESSNSLPVRGLIKLRRMGPTSNRWFCEGSAMIRTDPARLILGHVDLTGELNLVKVQTSTGFFNGGSVRVNWI